jgi:hypothetical protein
MKIVLIAAAVLLVVLVVGLKMIPPNDEPLTELYFDNHTTLPKAYAPVVTEEVFEHEVLLEEAIGASIDVMQSRSSRTTAREEERSTVDGSSILILGGGADELTPFTIASDESVTTYWYAQGIRTTTIPATRYERERTVNQSVLRLVKRSTITYPTIRFSFAVHNLENRDMAYNYLVLLHTENTTRVVHEETLLVGINETMHVPVDLSIPEQFVRARVQVALQDRNESIHFWVERK